MTMRAEVISIGDEMTSGQRLDTNSQWLSRQLGDLGIRVLYHTTVGDDLDANVEVFRRAAERADVVIATGGLGPTADDLTREALAAMVNVPLCLNQASLRGIEQMFARRQRPMPERNRVQALFPEGMRPIPNPHGTAPGIEGHLKTALDREVHLYALPGVPAEMREMWHGSVQPSLEKILGARQVIRHRCIKCFGVGESDLEQMLPDLIRRGRVPTVGITVSMATISLRISCHGPSDEACLTMMEPTLRTIRETLGDLVFGEEDEELEHVVLRELANRGQTLAVVESGTSGLLSHWLNASSPALREAFRGSIVLGPGQTFPGSPAGHLPASREDAAPSEASAWAEAARRMFQTDFGLALGPWPLESDDLTAVPVPFAVASPSQTIHRLANTAGHPDILQARLAKQALNLLRLTLLGRFSTIP